MKVNIKAFAIAGGVIWGGLMLLMTLWLLVRNLGSQPVIFELIYPGYSVSAIGSLIGMLYGFIDGAVICLGMGLLYNYLLEWEDKNKARTAK